jgi:hypothetical protein
MEHRFGHDFGHVRVHADARAADSAQAVNALAYTVGDDIVFGQGRYRPRSRAGQRLLAHELAHTVQQSRGTGARQGIAPPNGDPERQADAIADHVVGDLDGPAAVRPSPLAASPVPRGSLQRQPDGGASVPAGKKLEKTVQDAAAEAAKKVEEKYKMRPHIPKAPQPRPAPDKPGPRKSPAPAPAEDLRPDPLAPVDTPAPTPVDPAKGAADAPKAPAAKKPDPGTAENQLAAGAAYQSGPHQAGAQVQAAFQDKNYVPGVAYDYCNLFHLQLGILQPTYTLQLVHLAPLKTGTPSAANPLPPPDTAQFSATISPAVLKVGDNLSIAPQIGIAGVAAGDAFGTTKGPGQSGGHTQALGIVNLQVDYKLSDTVSLTGTVGYQEGVDSGPKGNNEVGNVTGSVLATFHFQ